MLSGISSNIPKATRYPTFSVLGDTGIQLGVGSLAIRRWRPEFHSIKIRAVVWNVSVNGASLNIQFYLADQLQASSYYYFFVDGNGTNGSVAAGGTSGQTSVPLNSAAGTSNTNTFVFDIPDVTAISTSTGIRGTILIGSTDSSSNNYTIAQTFGCTGISKPFNGCILSINSGTMNARMMVEGY